MVAPSTHSSACEQALARARRGEPVFPGCWPDAEGRCACPGKWAPELRRRVPHEGRDIGKAPFTSHGVLDATTDEAQIIDWWTQYPEANVLLALEPAVRVMIDTDSAAAEQDVRQRGMPATTIRHSRNRAYLCKRTTDCPTISATKLGESGALDIKAEGYAVVYGRHREGQDIYTEDFEPADVPTWVVELLQRVERTRAAKKDVQFTPDPEAVAKGQQLYSRIRRRLPERIQRTIEEGPSAYAAAPEQDGIVRIRPPDVSRSGADGSVVYYLVRLGLSDDDIRNIYAAFPIGALGKYGERGDAYLKTTIGNQRGYVERTTLHAVGETPSGNRNDHHTDMPPPNGHDRPAAAGPDELPQIDAGELDLRIITAQAWEALQRANGDEPYLFRHANTVKRVEPNDAGRLVLQEMTPDRLRHELARGAEFYTVKKSREGLVRKVVLPPTHVVRDLLATPNMPLPIVARVVECPTFAPDGTLQLRRGYHPASRVYCAMPGHLVVPPVPPDPSAADLATARSLWFDEVLIDFPFVGAADRANALALAIQPIVRGLIAGPTPLHVAESPSPGTGKGLLLEALLYPTCGRNAVSLSQAGDDDEWRKRLTANVLQGPPAIVFDNLTHTLDSGSLASMLTREDWTDRVLGQTTVVNVPILNAWAATANNVSMSTEIARRSIRIRLDPGQDQPWNRSGPRDGQPWRHERLLEWVDAHRGELLWALLGFTQAWLRAGRPRFSGRALGSYERWTDVVGGILEHVGIDGFLDNLSEFYEQADIETTTWRAFVELWWEKYQNTEVGTSDLFPLAVETDGMDLGTGSEKAQRTAFGMALGRQRDRVIGIYRVVRTREVNRAARWRLLPTDGRGGLL